MTKKKSKPKKKKYEPVKIGKEYYNDFVRRTKTKGKIDFIGEE